MFGFVPSFAFVLGANVRRRKVVCGFSAEEPPGKNIVLGLNEYSHDASVAVADASTGRLLFAASKERITRRKHDAGETGELVAHALESLGLEAEDVKLVVTNNHHFRVLPFEKRLPFAVGIGAYPPSVLQDPIRGKVEKMEISHHLAHAWSVLPLCPFDEGLIVVMDGMGEHIREFTSRKRTGQYVCDYQLPKLDDFMEFPAEKEPFVGYREAESVYLFDKMNLSRVYKRWTAENSPPELYNHGFENMESLGALYSRVSSHIFGDWNTCGKVMGLAPYADGEIADLDSSFDENRELFTGQLITGDIQIDFEALDQLSAVNDWSNEENRGFYIHLAHKVQQEVEDEVLSFLKELRVRTGAKNLCFAGGVALNSTINGAIIREAGFEKVYIPPYPGDDGISVGCAMYGAFRGSEVALSSSSGNSAPSSPYLGKLYNELDIQYALEDPEIAPYIVVEEAENEDVILEKAVRALEDGRILGWYQGPSEHGPRALGNRSLLADPRDPANVTRLNRDIKRRESFRPFAPSVLADRANEIFELDGLTDNASPFMSLTANVREHMREVVPAVTHVDGTARLQTVRKADNEKYYRLIQLFEERTSVPLVLNTSFNVAGEPIVESPTDALRTFLQSPIDGLVIDNSFVLKRAVINRLEEVWSVHISASIIEIEQRLMYGGLESEVYVSLLDRKVQLLSEFELELVRYLWEEDPEDEDEITVAECRQLMSMEEVPSDDCDRALLSLHRQRIIHFRDVNGDVP